MRKLILFLSVCALVPMVTIAVARAEDDELVEEEYQEEEYSAEEEVTDDAADADVADADATDYVEEEASTDTSTSESGTRGVAKRMTCAEIKKEMDRLSAIAEPEDAEVEQLYRVKSDYRAKCMQKAGGRVRGPAKPKEVRTAADLAVDSGGATSCTTPDDNGCCPGEKYVHLANQGFVCCTANNERCFPPMETPKTKAKKPVTACDDGSKPDKNGCCKGEKYTDLGAQGFNCCKSDGVTCFPPIK